MKEQEQLHDMWKMFVFEGKLHPDMESMIQSSWMRSKENHVDPFQTIGKEKLSEKEIQQKLRKKKGLIDTAQPLMKTLYHYIKGTGFLVTLSDEEGYLLIVIGDEDERMAAEKINFVVGANWSEEVMGTNAIGTAIKDKLPTQIMSYQHFSVINQSWSCSASPIFNRAGKMIGVLNVSGLSENMHPHTLGMVVSNAKAIENQLMVEEMTLQWKNHKIATKTITEQVDLIFDDIIGENPFFLQSITDAKLVAKTDSTVLIMGESGTGKDLFAQAIHNESARRDFPFIAINCGAIPKELLASELFGYVDGAFTGARRGGCAGKFELAHEGTVFLDEIAEMSLAMQVLLLRVLQNKTVTRIGGAKEIPVNVRIIAATNKNLQQEVSNGRFREDLFFRLNVMPIQIPSLRYRKDDIPILVHYFVVKLGEKLQKDIPNIPDDVMDFLCKYDWQGNVRELQNVLEYAMVKANARVLSVELFPAYMNIQRNEEQMDFPPIPRKDIIQKQAIEDSIDKYDGNFSRAAKYLGISRSTLYRKMKRYHIH